MTEKTEKYVIRVKSDNFNGCMTEEAYDEFRCLLSSEDFHTHSHERVRFDSLTASEVKDLLQLSHLRDLT